MENNYHLKHLQESYPLKMKDSPFGLMTGVKFEHSDKIKSRRKRLENGWRVKWKCAFYDFSQSTTLHGLNKITEENAFTIRR